MVGIYALAAVSIGAIVVVLKSTTISHAVQVAVFVLRLSYSPTKIK